MRLSRTIGKAALLLALSATFFTADAFAQQSSADNTIATITRNKQDNTPKSIYFSADAKWSVSQDQEIFKKYLGLGADNAMVLAKSTKTSSGIVTSRYFQYFRNVKVEYGVATLTSKDEKVSYLTSNFYNTDNSADPVPGITEDAALKSALSFVGAQKYMWEDPNMEARAKRHYNKDTSYFPHGQLVWIEDYSNGMNSDRKLHLAYKFDVYAQTPISRSELFIDATTGKVLFSNSLIKHVATTGNSLYSGLVPIETILSGGTYQLQDLTRGSGVHTFDMQKNPLSTGVEITSLTNTWTGATVDSVAIDAQWGGEKVYDFWQTMGRNSWDDAYGVLEQYVHYRQTAGVDYDNAFWDGAEMIYGDGTGCAAGGFSPLTALDVTGHEIGHGVCQATANLVYAGESGAMNEGFSDCWGATIESYANPHETDAVAKSVWEIGEELGCGNPLRHMDFPKIKGNPDTYNGVNWVTTAGCVPDPMTNDNCGVHNNSGLLNKWYYLITAGGSGTNDIGNAYVVAPLGSGPTTDMFYWAKQILYQTELTLAPTDDYMACRNTSIAAATALAGGNPCDPMVQTVTDAWYAIGVGTAFSPCAPEIGFTAHILTLTENAATLACPASRAVTIDLQPTGPLISGGSPTVNIVYGRGSAVSGRDYTISPSGVTWPAGSTAIKTVTLTLIDNGAVNDDKDLVLGLTLSAAGSNATLSPAKDSLYITISNDDMVPEHTEYHTLNQGTLITSNLTSAFTGANNRGHSQFLLSAAQMAAAGVKPNAPISQIAFNIVAKNSTSPYVGYTIKMANTPFADLGSAFVTAALTTVYTGSPSTNMGLDSLDFNVAKFTWNGTSNVVVEICYGMNATAGGNDQMDGIENSTWYACDHNGTTTGSGTGCSLPYNPSTTTGLGTARPVMRFKQTVPPSGVETVAASSHTWDVRAGQEVYFFNTTNGKLMAGLKNVSNNLGCVTGTITQAGTGFTPAVFSPVNRSRKEFSITPTINGSTTTYDATIYFTTAELGGAAPSSLYLVKTDEPTDATITASNSISLVPAVITAAGYVGFKGSFTGFSRFFLTDGPLCNTPVPSVTAGGPLSFCPGGNVVLSGNTGAGLTYQWQVAGGTIPGETNSTYTVTTPGNYTLKEFSGSCNATSSVVTVSYAAPSAGTITGVTGICAGQTNTLSDAVPGGIWSSTNTAIATIGSTSGMITGVSAGTLVISYDVSNTCGAATATTTITVNSVPVVAPITGTMTMCASGSTVSLADITASGIWSSGRTSVATVSSTGLVTSGVAGTAPISYSVTNGFGCTASAVTSVTVTASPSTLVTAPGGTAICPGGSTVVLNGPVGVGLTYQWETSGGGIPGSTASSFTASAVGSYDVVVTNSLGCSATSAVIAVTSGGAAITPAVSITSFPGTTVCASGGAVLYTPVPVNGGSAPAYQWYVNGRSVSTAAAYSYIPADLDVVMCKLTSNAACATPDTAITAVVMSVTGAETPSVSIASSPGDAVCAGTLVTYTATSLFGGAAPVYQWSRNSIPVASGSFYSCVPDNGDIITCRLASDYLCVTTPFATSTPLIAAVNAAGANNALIRVSSPDISAGQKDTFTVVTPLAGVTFQWFLNGVAIPEATNAVYITDGLANGQEITCSVTTSDPCFAPAVSYSNGIKVLVSTGISEQANTVNNFTLVPNPTSGTFTISGALSNKADNKLTITITDMLGQVVYKQAAQAQNGKLSERITLAASLANGMYMVNLTSGEANVVFHVTLNR